MPCRYRSNVQHVAWVLDYKLYTCTCNHQIEQYMYVWLLVLLTGTGSGHLNQSTAIDGATVHKDTTPTVSTVLMTSHSCV